MKPAIRILALGLVLCFANSVHSDSVSIDLGTVNIENGITHGTVPNAAEHKAGQTIRAWMGGVNCRRNAVPFGRTGNNTVDMYFLFPVDDAFVFSGNKPVLYVTIEYFDVGMGELYLEYDSTGGLGRVGSAPLTDTNVWKWHTFHLTDARFANGLNSGSDFRILREVGAQESFYLNRVIVDDDVLPSCGIRVLPADAQTVRAVRGQAAKPASLTYAVQNVGRQNDLTWQVQETDATGVVPTDCTWLSIVPPASGGPLDLMETGTVQVQIDSTDLPQGTHTAYVTFTDGCDPANSLVRQIDLVVVECGLEISPAGDMYTSSSCSDSASQPVVYKIRNGGMTSVTWAVAVSPGAAWLQLDDSGGTIAPGDPPHVVTGTIDASGLAVGVYTATLQFTDSCSPQNQYSRDVVLSVFDPSCVYQQFNGEFQPFWNKNLYAESSLIRYPEGYEVARFKTQDTDENPFYRRLSGGDWLWQSHIEGGPTTVKFWYDWDIAARERFQADLPFDDQLKPAFGIAAAWRLKVGNYVMEQGPIQILLPTKPGSPGGGYSTSVSNYTLYVRINEGAVVGILNADGKVYPGLHELELAESVADGQFHTWAASGCYDVTFTTGYAYWNLWLDGQRLLFGGSEGTVTGPGGATFSFRTETGASTLIRRPYIALGEMGNRGVGLKWDFEFDWVRVVSMSIPGCPYWGGEGLAGVAALWPDADEDGDVDQVDFAAVQLCYTGAEGVATQACQRFNRDADGDVDAADLDEFKSCVTGPAIALDPAAPPSGCVPY